MAEEAGPTRIRVCGAAPYDVVVGGREALADLPRLVGPTAERVALIHDGDLAAMAAGPQAELTAAGHRVVTIPLLPPGERSKRYASAEACWETLGAEGFTRSDVVVTLGGGATTDLGGFVAATWLRGVRVIHLPTTLLGMVDAAVGGKTGLNTGAGKNLVGAFHEPAGVLCDLTLLGSLPTVELVAGLGEVVKCGFIADPEILAVVERSPRAVLDPASPELRELVERAVRVKAAVVAADLKETGGADGHPGREVLNYGHTLAHAIEKVTDYSVRHGEAVALGMVYVAELARLSGLLGDEVAARHRTALDCVGLPTSIDGLDFDELLAAMHVDKKARGSHLRFIVLDDLASPVVLTDPPEAVLRAAYDHLREGPR